MKIMVNNKITYYEDETLILREKIRDYCDGEGGIS